MDLLLKDLYKQLLLLKHKKKKRSIHPLSELGGSLLFISKVSKLNTIVASYTLFLWGIVLVFINTVVTEYITTRKEGRYTLVYSVGYGIELWITVNQALHNWQWMQAGQCNLKWTDIRDIWLQKDTKIMVVLLLLLFKCHQPQTLSTLWVLQFIKNCHDVKDIHYRWHTPQHTSNQRVKSSLMKDYGNF